LNWVWNMELKIFLSDIDLRNEEIEAVTDVLTSKWLTMGEVTQRFEAAFAEYLGVKHAFAVTNGTAALHIAHKIIGVKEGEEVICPSLTFVATSNSILYTGGIPVFADVKGLDDLNVSPERIREKITDKTKAITVVHYGGYPCEMDTIMEIARSHHLRIIEDAAHAPGAEYKGKKLGTIGDIGCFSFFSNKNMTTGEGGMVVTNNDEFAERIRLIRSHGMTSLTLDRHKGHAYSYDVLVLGYNCRIDEIRAAIGIEQLKKLDKNNSSRKEIVELYHNLLKEIDEISIPFRGHLHESSFHIFPIVLKAGIDTNKFREYLTAKGIQTSMHYPPIHLFSFYREKFGYKEGFLPITEEVGRREVTLPLYPQLDYRSVKYIVDEIKNTLASPK
jgi:dTDP-4-amino-4,6-dideoxygalactose transaminase